MTYTVSVPHNGMPRSKEFHQWLDEWSSHLTEQELQDIFSLRERGRLERWLDRHNHKMELLRTLGSATAAITGVLVFLKLFNII